MRTIILFLIYVAISCRPNDHIPQEERFIIETTVKIKSNKTDEVLQLFKNTNPDLVKDESDWINATFSAVENENKVIVRAEWRNKQSYIQFSNSEAFKNTMSLFGKHFEGKPEVTISKILFEM